MQITENDEVDGTDDGDEIYVGLGDDIVRGHEGDDDIAGGDGRDMLSGGDDRDTIDGGAGSDTIDGGAGDDMLTGGTGQVQTGALSNALVNFGPGAAAGSWASQESVPRLVGDIDGDGTADVVGFGGARTFTSLNDGTGTLGDLAAGVDNFAQAQQWLSQDGQTRLLGDVDGDGDDDIIGFGGKVTFTALGQGDGTFGDFTTAIENFSKGQGWATNDTFLRLSGDVNGDGQDDIIGFGAKATYTAISNGDGTFGDFKRGIDNFAQSQGWGDNDSTPRLVGDVNGDGLADIIGFGGSTTFAALGLGDGTFGAIETLSKDFNRGSGWTSFDALPRAVADMNGDGTDDLIGFSSKGVLVQITGVETDVFVFEDRFGQDTITDFGAGPTGDQIDVSELSNLEDPDDILDRAVQGDEGTRIAYEGNMLRLNGVDLTDLTDSNFIFA